MRYGLNELTDGKKVLIKSFFSTVPIGKRQYREHHHTECELSVFLSGSGTYTTKDRQYDFIAGDCFLFCGDEPHCITGIASQFELLNIHFHPQLLWSQKDDLTLLQILGARSSRFENRLDRSNPATAVIRNRILSIEKELSEKRNGYQTVAKCELFTALISFIRDYDYIDSSKEYAGFEKVISPVEHALNYIDENLDKPLTLAEISKQAAMSQTYFSSVFKKLNGVSPWEYITVKRVEKAIELLKGTRMTKLDIALQCGFNSSSNFYKAFYHVTGKKPGDYSG